METVNSRLSAQFSQLSMSGLSNIYFVTDAEGHPLKHPREVSASTTLSVAEELMLADMLMGKGASSMLEAMSLPNGEKMRAREREQSRTHWYDRQHGANARPKAYLHDSYGSKGFYGATYKQGDASITLSWTLADLCTKMVVQDSPIAEVREFRFPANHEQWIHSADGCGDRLIRTDSQGRLILPWNFPPPGAGEGSASAHYSGCP
jgi:hypothetical protein